MTAGDIKRMTLTVVKCPCGHPVCTTHGLKPGTFYQGNGWNSKEEAQRVADCVNACAGIEPKSVPLLLQACAEFVRKVEAGEARSTRSYAQMKEALKIADPVDIG